MFRAENSLKVLRKKSLSDFSFGLLLKYFQAVKSLLRRVSVERSEAFDPKVVKNIFFYLISLSADLQLISRTERISFIIWLSREGDHLISHI